VTPYLIIAQPRLAQLDIKKTILGKCMLEESIQKLVKYASKTNGP
jgi:hypothetical protein